MKGSSHRIAVIIGLCLLLGPQLSAAQSDAVESAAERLAALEAHGLRQLRGGERAAAIVTFQQLLSLDPGHQLQSSNLRAPDSALFARLRQRFVPAESVELTLRVPPRLPAQGSIMIRARLSGPIGGVNEVIAFTRRVGETGATFQPLSMPRAGDLFAVQLEAPPVGQGLELYVEVRAPSEYILVNSGTPADPLRLEAAAVQQPGVEGSSEHATEPVVAPRERDAGHAESGLSQRPRRQWYRSWWFWTIVGAVVAGGAATAVVLTLPEEDGAGTLGTLDLP